MMFWILVTLAVGVMNVKTAVRHRHYKEIAVYGVLTAAAVTLALIVQRNPAQISLATMTLRMLHLE